MLDAASEAVLAFDYSKVRGRCVRRLGWSEAFVDRVLLEYKRFLVLKLRCESATATAAELSPSDTIDALWHLHVLDTADYSVKLSEACGRVILHDPSGADDVAARKVRAEKTKLCYAALFNASPPVDIWDNESEPVAEVAPADSTDGDSSDGDSISCKRARRDSDDYVIVQVMTKFEIPVDLASCTGGMLEKKVQSASGIDVKYYRLVVHGTRLNPNCSLADCGVLRGEVIDLIPEQSGC